MWDCELIAVVVSFNTQYPSISSILFCWPGTNSEDHDTGSTTRVLTLGTAGTLQPSKRKISFQQEDVPSPCQSTAAYSVLLCDSLISPRLRRCTFGCAAAHPQRIAVALKYIYMLIIIYIYIYIIKLSFTFDKPYKSLR